MKRLDDWMRPHRRGRGDAGGDAQQQAGAASAVVIVATFFAASLLFGLVLLDRSFWDAALVAAATALGAALGVVLIDVVRRRSRRKE